MLAVLLACAPEPDAPAVRFPADTGQVDADDAHLGLVQLDCEGWIGESMLIVGPDGTRVLLDVGNDDHAASVSAAVTAYTGTDHVDTVILTHFHEDHAGGLGRLAVTRDVLVSRGAVHLDAVSLPDGMDQSERVDLCTPQSCTLPWTLPLGAGAELVIFAADGQIAGERFAGLPSDDDGENARSLVGEVRWGDFLYLWNGDLTGGGKGTPNVEAFYADRSDEWVPPEGATIAHLGHHGIDSSTQQAWVERIFPDDGSPRAALVGSNSSYLDAPADEVLDRVRGRVAGVWVTRGGALTGGDAILHDVEGDVVVDVTEDGRRVSIVAGGETTSLR